MQKLCSSACFRTYLQYSGCCDLGTQWIVFIHEDKRIHLYVLVSSISCYGKHDHHKLATFTFCVHELHLRVYTFEWHCQGCGVWFLYFTKYYQIMFICEPLLFPCTSMTSLTAKAYSKYKRNSNFNHIANKIKRNKCIC